MIDLRLLDANDMQRQEILALDIVLKVGKRKRSYTACEPGMRRSEHIYSSIASHQYCAVSDSEIPFHIPSAKSKI